MQRIDTVGKAVDLFGPGKHGFRDGDPVAGIAATRLSALWFNLMQEEICNVIEGLNIALDADANDQLLTALRVLSTGKVTAVAGNVALTHDDAGTIVINAAGGNVTLTLPAANQAIQFRFARIDATANTVTIQRAGTDTIDGVDSFTLTAPQHARHIVADGVSTWHTIVGAVATATRAGIVELATNDETQTGTDNERAVTPAGLAAMAAAGGIVPAGAAMAFAMEDPPDGWFEANGAAVSRSTYSGLFAKIGTTWGGGDGATTFNLPDLRGEFLRGWDNGRGADSGRAFASYQADAFQGHRHASMGGQTGGQKWPDGQNSTGVTHSGIVLDPIAGLNGTPRTANETRPRNRAVMFCIKY